LKSVSLLLPSLVRLLRDAFEFPAVALYVHEFTLLLTARLFVALGFAPCHHEKRMPRRATVVNS
jgi:hypothetical protein